MNPQFVSRQITRQRPVFCRSVLAIAVSAAISGANAAQFNTTVTTVEVVNDAYVVGFDVTALPNDQFAVVWAVHDYDAGDQILLQRYNASGVAVGSQVVVYTHTTSNKELLKWPRVAADDQGDLVMGWTVAEYGPGGLIECDFLDVTSMVYRVDASNEIQAIDLPDSFDSDQTCGIEVAMDADGDFVISWAVRDQTTRYLDLYALTYNNLNQVQSPLINLATQTVYPASLAMQSDGAFMLAWPELDNLNSSLMGQRYGDINGTKIGTKFRIDNQSNEADIVQFRADISTDAEGGYVAIWVDQTAPSGFAFPTDPFQDDLEYRLQRWAADGTAKGGLVLSRLTNMEDSGTQHYTRPSISSDATGNILAAWTFEQNAYDYDLAELAHTSNQLMAVDSRDQKTTSSGQEIAGPGEYGVAAYDLGARVAVSNHVAAVVWIDNTIFSDDSTNIQMRFLTSNNTNGGNSGSSSQTDSGGSFGLWLTGLLGLLVGFRRFAKSR